MERAGLLEVATVADQAQVRLIHPLYADVLRATTPPIRRRDIFRDLADALESTGRADPLRLATWRIEGTGVADHGLLVAGARRALSLFDYPLAERLARAAVAAGGGRKALLVLSSTLVGRGRFDEADAILAELVGSAESDSDLVRSATARAQNLFWRLGRTADAEAVIAEADPRVREAAWRDELSAQRAMFLVFGGRIAGAVDVASAVLADHGASDRARLHAMMPAAFGLLLTGRGDRTIELAALGAELAKGRGAQIEEGWLREQWSSAHLFAGRLAEAAAGLHERYREGLERAAHPIRPTNAFLLGVLARTEGRMRTGIGVLREAVVMLRDVDLYRMLPWCLGQLAHCHALLGEVTEAEAALADAEAEMVDEIRWGEAWVGFARTWTAAARGEISRAVELSLETAAAAEGMRQLPFRAEALHDVARLGEARRVVSELERLSPDVDGVLVELYARHADALARQDPHDITEVSGAFATIGATLYAAEAAAEAAHLHREAGRKGSALTMSARARALADRCEGARTPALSGIDAPLPLTKREREIATLAASGLTNKEIAERLVVSVRTVDNHLHNAYAKLEVSGREELGAILLPDGSPRRAES